MSAAQPQTIPFRRPPILTGQLAWTLAILAASLAASIAALPPGGDRGPAVLGTLSVGALFTMTLLIQALLARRGRGLPPLTVTPAELALPVSTRSRRVARLHLDEVRSVVAVGGGWTRRVVIDTGNRAFAYPERAFAAPAPADAVRAALHAALAARADGATLWRAMEHRRAVSEARGHARPLATWAVLAILAVSLVLTQATGRPTDPLRLLDVGANAPVLVWHGQWFRLVMASLLLPTPRQLLGSGASLLLAGAILERLAGARTTLVLLLASCIAGQLAAAAAGVAGLPGAPLFTAGIAGGVFGLLAAVGVVTARFGAELPAGLRLPTRAWLVLGVLNGVMLPFAAPQLSFWANAGGALCGAALAWLLCHRRGSVLALRQPEAPARAAPAVLLLVMAADIAASLLHGASPAARLQDRLLLARDVRAGSALPAAARDALAFSIAYDPQSPSPLLREGALLAAQAVLRQRRLVPPPASKPTVTARIAQARLDSYLDTAAMLEARLGGAGSAAESLAGLPWATQPYASHLALALDRALHGRGMEVVGSASPGTAGPAAPDLILDHGTIRLTQAAPATRGAQIYAVLRSRDRLQGVLYFQLPPGFYGTQLLPLPTQLGPPGPNPPPAFWLDPASRIEVALFDRRGCFCDWPRMGPSFAPYDPAWSFPQ